MMMMVISGCSEQNTGDHRIDMKLWYYNPMQPATNGTDVMMDSEISIFVEEYWSGYFSDSYSPVEDADITFNDRSLPFEPSIRGYSEINLLIEPGDSFTLNLDVSPTVSYTFTDSIPDISVHGLPSASDTVLTPNDTLQITWLEIPGIEARLDIIRDGVTIESHVHRKVFRWSPRSSYSGDSLQLEFNWTYLFPGTTPFNVMQYEYFAQHYVEVE